jgi:tRNA(fMet)-specific endonuclease VapC
MNARYLLDTNICIHFLRGDFNLNGKLAEVGFDQCAISEITLIELIYGAENSRDPDSNLKVVRAFQESLAVLSISACIHRFGKEKVRLRKAGRPISDLAALHLSTDLC